MGEMKTPEQMAEEWAKDWHKDCDYPPEILIHTKRATATVFLAGYQAAKDEYKVAIDTYNDVAKQMLEEAIRIMSPKDQLADAGKVMNSPEKLDSWISVKDRLPDRDQEVLGYEKPFISTCLFWKLRYTEHQWELSNGRNCNPTHWMPLPDAPKEEK